MAERNTENPPGALVIGATGGIGRAVASRLRDNDWVGPVTTLSRRTDGLDITDEASIKGAAKELSGHTFKVVFDATGALEIDGAAPEKSFAELDAETMLKGFAVNAVGPALLMKHFAPLLDQHEPSVFATLSARIGSVGDNRLGGWMTYRSSKAALNQLVRCASIEFGRSNENAIFVALHPGTIETPLSKKYARGRFTATPEEAAENLISVMRNLSPRQSGGFFAYDGDEIEW